MVFATVLYALHSSVSEQILCVEDISLPFVLERISFMQAQV